MALVIPDHPLIPVLQVSAYHSSLQRIVVASFSA